MKLFSKLNDTKGFRIAVLCCILYFTYSAFNLHEITMGICLSLLSIGYLVFCILLKGIEKKDFLPEDEKDDDDDTDM